MPRKRVSLPAYRCHRASKQAVVTLNGHDFYLGSYGSIESRDAYDRLLTEWLTAGRVLPAAFNSTTLCIADLLLAYREYAAVTFVKYGEPTSHLHNVDDAIRVLNDLYGDETVTTFGPLKFKVVQHAFVARGLARSTVNKHSATLKRIFRWGVSNELVPAAVYQALQAVEGLRRGRTAAPEPRRVKPVLQEHIDAACKYVSPQVEAMIRLQELTGMRPGSAVMMRGCDLDISGETWVYRPAQHKTEHHDLELVVHLGPRARAIVEKFLTIDTTAYLFSPVASEQWRNEKRRSARLTPLRTGQQCPARTSRELGDCYTVCSYRRAIARACDQAGVPRWSPNQLRHNAATKFRREFGLDAARAILGHQSSVVTEMYADLDITKAAEIMAKVG
jgi:integrase